MNNAVAEAPNTEPTEADIVAKMRSDVETLKENNYQFPPATEESAGDEPEADKETAEAQSPEDIYSALGDSEKAAWDKGWRPKELFEGEEGKWVDAEKFLDREPFFGRIADLNKAVKSRDKELAALKKAVETLAELNKTAYMKGHAEAKAALEEQRKTAFEDRDLEAFEEAEAKLAQLQEEAAAVSTLAELEDEEEQPAQPQQLAPEVAEKFNSWVDKNASWFNKDPEATAVAKAIAERVNKENQGKSEVEILEKVLAEIDHRVTKRFPELFRNPARKQGSPVGTGAGKGHVPAKPTIEGMDEQSRRIMKKVLAVTPGLTEEEYIKQYNSNRK